MVIVDFQYFTRIFTVIPNEVKDLKSNYSC